MGSLVGHVGPDMIIYVRVLSVFVVNYTNYDEHIDTIHTYFCVSHYISIPFEIIPLIGHNIKATLTLCYVIYHQLQGVHLFLTIRKRQYGLSYTDR